MSKYGIDNIIILIIIGFISLVLGAFLSKWFLSYPLIILGLITILFTLWFFRDPERKISPDATKEPSLILSPADGKVVEIKEIFNEYFGENIMQISIFLSPLDVHVNRIPIEGVIDYFKYVPGKYLIAFHPKSSELNEQTNIGMITPFGKFSSSRLPE